MKKRNPWALFSGLGIGIFAFAYFFDRDPFKRQMVEVIMTAIFFYLFFSTFKNKKKSKTNGEKNKNEIKSKSLPVNTLEKPKVSFISKEMKDRATSVLISKGYSVIYPTDTIPTEAKDLPILVSGKKGKLRFKEGELMDVIFSDNTRIPFKKQKNEVNPLENTEGEYQNPDTLDSNTIALEIKDYFNENSVLVGEAAQCFISPDMLPKDIFLWKLIAEKLVEMNEINDYKVTTLGVYLRKTAGL